MLSNHELDPKSQVNSNPLPEPEFLDSPFDRWVRLADVILEKHKHPEKAQDTSC